jgi:hypothetical protein
MIYQQNYLERYTCWKTQPIKKRLATIEEEKKMLLRVWESNCCHTHSNIWDDRKEKKHEINVLTHTLQAKFLHKGMKVV